MKKQFVLFILCLAINVKAQEKSETPNIYLNTADKLLAQNEKLTIGGYGEVHYNQQLSSDNRYNGTLDVHRFVMLIGYHFSQKTQFITEIEYEHVKEVYIEQAFLQHKISGSMNLRSGLLLIPMGIINEYHEPVSFNGVERPFIENKIAPTTWREIGIGLSGNLLPAHLKYQAYLVNGFNGYDGTPRLSGKNGLRSGRQKGAESYISTPNFAGKIEYYGLRGLNLGLSGYFGKSQSSLYNGISKDDVIAKAKADSSVVGISMIGIDGRYSIVGFQLKGQYYYTRLSNTIEYNQFTSSDLGRVMDGLYVEAAYNVLHHSTQIESQLIPFVRYEHYNTHAAVEGNLAKNKSYCYNIFTGGLSWKIASGVVLKSDIQFVRSKAESKYKHIFNAGFGIMF